MKDIEHERDFERTWIYIDMDMFYAAVEILDRPELSEKPVAVGGESMVSTANYVARKYGVRSAMPGFIAKKICPELVLIPCNFEKYKRVSKIFKSILEEYDSEYESMGLDEANIDATDYLIKNNMNTSEGKQQLA
jgi:DNA polymerase kappa